MKIALETLGLGMPTESVTKESRSFRPPSWPPPRDWVVTEDRDGAILSRWGQAVWNISPWTGKSMTLDFGNGDDSPSVKGKCTPLDEVNAELLRMATTWRIWGIRGCNSANSLKHVFFSIRRIIALCSKNKIPASSLMQYPRLLEELVEIIPPTEFDITIRELHRLWVAREYLGFYIATPEAISKLKSAAPDHERVQTAYIPPRIWTYQIERLKACIEDYLTHKHNIEKCFHYCLNAYAEKFGSLEAAMISNAKHKSPFEIPRRGDGLPTRREHLGHFRLTAERFGIATLLEKWANPNSNGINLISFTSYLSLVQYAGISYIANFSLQRISEALSLRSDCLIWELDEKLGRIPIICGETTKTDVDSDARWPTSPSVEPAVEAMIGIARMRMHCAISNPKFRPSKSESENPYLFSGVYEPWSNGKTPPYEYRPTIAAYISVYDRFRQLFAPEEMKITEEDLRIARMLTPNLSENKGFKVGEIWPLSWHQLRRTGAVNMLASGLISNSSLQFLLKHASRLMPLYYGQGYSKLLLNSEVETTIIDTMYETMGRKLEIVLGDRFISPNGTNHKEAILVNLISTKDLKSLIESAKDGQLSIREMRIGCCTRRSPCPYGGVESISRCTGGDGKGPCADVLYDRDKVTAIQEELLLIDNELERTPLDSPRYKALLAERKGLENFLNVVQNCRHHS